jgi:hypothetical protein
VAAGFAPKSPPCPVLPKAPVLPVFEPNIPVPVDAGVVFWFPNNPPPVFAVFVPNPGVALFPKPKPPVVVPAGLAPKPPKAPAAGVLVAVFAAPPNPP